VPEINVKLTPQEIASLVAAATLGMQSGKLLTVFKTFEQDNALVTALVKLRLLVDQTG
jgi:hypothetical protein